MFFCVIETKDLQLCTWCQHWWFQNIPDFGGYIIKTREAVCASQKQNSQSPQHPLIWSDDMINSTDSIQRPKKPLSINWVSWFFKKRIWLHRCNLNFQHRRRPLVITTTRSSCHGPENDSHTAREWCPGWISFCPTGSALSHSPDVFECLGPRGQHLILHWQKSITKPISLHLH